MLPCSLFPLKERWPLPRGHEVSYVDVFSLLKDQMTEERRARVEEVLQQRNFFHTLVLENIYDRGNASAVMRTAEALGYAHLHVIETGEKFKAANRVTQGADKWLMIEKWKSTEHCIKDVKRRGYQVCVTTLEDATPLGEVDFSKPSALVLGNEHAGASEAMHQLADVRVKIPMSGFVQSFNISVAGAICLYHLYRELETLGSDAWRLSETQKDILRAYYYYQAVDGAADKLYYSSLSQALQINSYGRHRLD